MTQDDIAAAWTEAEAALPEGWRIHLVERSVTNEYRAVAGVERDIGTNPFIAIGTSDDGWAAALRALAARLRAAASPPTDT